MKCYLCGDTETPMHRVGESRTTGRPTYACDGCDPISEQTAKELKITIHYPKQKEQANEQS